MISSRKAWNSIPYYHTTSTILYYARKFPAQDHNYGGGVNVNNVTYIIPQSFQFFLQKRPRYEEPHAKLWANEVYVVCRNEVYGQRYIH